MTIQPSITRSGPYTANGAQTTFGFGFKIYDKTDLQIVETDTNGADSIVNPLSYNVATASLNNDAGGNIVYTAAPLSGKLVTILLNPSVQQQTNLRNQSAYNPEDVERALDRQCMISQSLKEQLSRCLKVGVSSTGTVDDYLTALQEASADAVQAAIDADASADAAAVSAATANAVATSLANFKQAGTGAQTRSYLNKMRDRISVMDFGAVGDGASHPLSTRYVSLSAAQVDYPFVTSLTQEIDWAAMQAVINNYPKAEVHLESKSFIWNATLLLPLTTRFLHINGDGGTVMVKGDITAIKSADNTQTISFFRTEALLIDTSEHTTNLRPAIDLQGISQGRFTETWINGVAGKTIGYYCQGASGSAPYYHAFDHGYIGNIKAGILFEDAADTAHTSNSNTVSNMRIQPGTGNFGVYVGSRNQNINIINNRFESTGGTGIYDNGISTYKSGNRHEGLDVGIAYATLADQYTDLDTYFDSVTSRRTYAGASQAKGYVINEYRVIANTPTTSDLRPFEEKVFLVSADNSLKRYANKGGSIVVTAAYT